MPCANHVGRRFQVLAIGFVALLGCRVHLELYRIEAAARVVDGMHNVGARAHVQVYVDLAKVALQQGRVDAAREALEKVLQLDSWRFEEQLTLARLELDTGRDSRGRERLAWVIAKAPDPALVARARLMAEGVGSSTQGSVATVTLALPGRFIRLLAFEGTRPALVESIAQAVRQEFGLDVRLAVDHPVPSLEQFRSGRVEACARFLGQQYPRSNRDRRILEPDLRLCGMTLASLDVPGEFIRFGLWTRFSDEINHVRGTRPLRAVRNL